jgi:phosphatidylinositol alpha-1,6-mannosyltransferase
LRVLVLTPDFPPARGGIQHVAARLAGHLKADTRVVTLGAALEDDAALNVRRVRSLRASGPAAVAALNVGGLREGFSYRPDAILSLHIFAAPASAALARLLKRPWIQYVYAMELAQKPGLARFALQRADAVIAISEYTRSLALDAGAKRHCVHIVHPGVDETTRAPGAEWAGRPTVLTISRLAERYKGHDMMARAIPLVAAAVPDVEWVVIGDGLLRAPLEALAGAPSNHVRFLGGVDDEQRDRRLDSAHVFAMPSRLPGGGFAGEGFGIVFLEAGAHGLPCVAGKLGGSADAVVDGETGLTVDATDHVAVADAITKLLLDPELRARLGEAGRARAARFSWARMAAEVDELVERVVAEMR